jgi:hypothetical protein
MSAVVILFGVPENSRAQGTFFCKRVLQGTVKAHRDIHEEVRLAPRANKAKAHVNLRKEALSLLALFASPFLGIDSLLGFHQNPVTPHDPKMFDNS